MTYNKSGFIDAKEDARQITFVDGSNMAIKQIGKWQRMITDKTGKQQLISLDEVYYVPALKYNLMSLTKALKNGWELSGNNQQLSLRKADDEMVFDKKMYSSNGHTFGIDIVSQNDRKKMVIKQAHSILGHVNRHQTIETSKKNVWIIRDLEDTFSCEGCQIAKAKRLIINKESRHNPPLQEKG
jgi:hypothetical protein